MCTVHGAILTVREIEVNRQASPPRSKHWPTSWRGAALNPQSKPSMSSAHALSSALPTGNAPIFIAAGGSRAQNLHFFTISLPTFSHLILRHSLTARFTGGFLLSQNTNRQIWPKDQMHPMKFYSMAWGHSFLFSLNSFKYLRTAERQEPQENILPNIHISALFQQRNIW